MSTANVCGSLPFLRQLVLLLVERDGQLLQLEIIQQATTSHLSCTANISFEQQLQTVQDVFSEMQKRIRPPCFFTPSPPLLFILVQRNMISHFFLGLDIPLPAWKTNFSHLRIRRPIYATTGLEFPIARATNSWRRTQSPAVA